MAPLKFPVQRLGDETHRVPLRTKIFSYFVMLFGPLFLIYLNLRCEKNQCVLFQLPLVIPTHAAAYFSASATLIVLGFILLLFIFSLTSKSPKFSGTRKEQPTMSTGFSSLLTSSMLLVALAYLRPEYIQSVHAEYLRILSVTTVLCFIFSIFLTCLTWFKVISKDRDYPFGLAIFFGNTTKLRILHMDLKYFLYVHVGLVTWGLLDLLHLLNFTIDHSVTAPLAFLTVSQYIVIGHMLLHENLLQRRPFNTTEGLGFFWMMRVLLYLPFLHSLPVFYAAAAEFTLPKPVILADCVLFLFGFVIYVSSVHQKESFVAAPLAYKNLKSITSNPGKRLLISGYWGIVQKPDYFGYVIMWMSWAIACGFSAVSVMVLLVIYGTVLLWLNQISKYNKSKFYNAWIRYNNLETYLNNMPRRPSKSPSRARARTRSKSASRSRSKSAGRKTKQIVSDVIVSQEKQVEKPRKKSPARRKSKSPSRTASVKETVITKRTIVSSSSGQVQASVTPVRSSSRISMLIEKEKEMAARVRNELKSEILSNITTPPKTNSTEIAEKPEKKTAQYEFMGPIGAFFLILMLPFTVYYVNLSCRKGKCSVLEIPKLPKIMALFEVEAALIFVAWFAFQVLLSVIPVGRVVEGQPLKYGGRLKYRCNGFFALVVSLAALGAAVYLKCPVTKVVDKFFKLMTTSVLFSFLLSIFLYISSKVVQPKKLAPGGNTGNVIYDFFIGRELNPRIGPLDLKFFCELRPGLIGWVMLDWIMVVKAYQDTGTFPQNLLLVTVFQTLYVADALWYEDAILTTMDIIHDGFGFMLAFGDLTWVPFLYCLQPRFLLETGFNLPWYCLAPIVLLNFLGYAIFRLSNSQKNDFRQNPKGPAVADIETLSTNTGKKLLVGGWWGMCRKPNYMGDLFMAFSWSLTTGVGHIFPYFYPVYFLVLLVHRERRDNEQCQKKYGASWDQYCERVKYRIFPYIY